MATQAKVSKLQEKIKSWGTRNLQDYPWRFVNDPYRVLVAEFMLHRTGADQVAPIYTKFIDDYPDLESFSQAPRSDIKEALASLGLKWRIESMVNALDSIFSDFGEVPQDFDQLKSVFGIGPYIAGATMCFAFGEPETLVDTNTVRVIGRVFGLNLEGEARRRKEVILTIGRTVDHEEPRVYYYSLIDLAHEICHPEKPECQLCPLLDVPCEYGTAQMHRTDIESGQAQTSKVS